MLNKADKIKNIWVMTEANAFFTNAPFIAYVRAISTGLVLESTP
jgi:hypothetical protein